ncbi:MAG: S8 family serine peptidase [Bacteroidales bacterium]|nr:S8 family serine peptidase [Bacteroidales bacterium]
MKNLYRYAMLALLFIPFGLISQVTTNSEALRKLAEEQRTKYEVEKALAVRWALLNDFPIREDIGGSLVEIQYIDEFGFPQYYKTDNSNAAISISTNRVYPGGGAGLNLTGAGITVRQWDGGNVRETHQEYGGRVTNLDASSNHYHSGHVAGTIMAAGVQAASKGMAYEADLRAYDFNNDNTEMANEATLGTLLSNHSYGFIRGWYGSTWYGNPGISTQEDYLFGFYDSYTQAWDQIAVDAPYYLIVKSAGNDRNDSGSGYPPDGPYDCIGQQGVAKNILTVGAVEDVNGGYSGPSSVVMSSFSSWGPADDGRIKPDIVANGVNLYSTDVGSDNDYQTLSGTSMSSPSATGSLALLQEHWEELNGSENYMLAATLKALVIHTADEAGSYTGPDYSFGWGLMNTETAALLITEDQSLNVIDELSLSNGNTYTREVVAKGTEPLKVTIVWTDPAGTPVSAQLDPITPMLVNDLDLRITEGSNTYYPWKLDRNNPSNAATNNSENNVDNVEVVYIANPSATTYTITVDHDGSLSSPQNFSLIVTGIDAAPKTWTGNVSTVWSNPANWSDAAVAGPGQNVVISSTAPNWPTYSGDLTIGSTCANIIMDGNSEMTVTGDLNISPGNALICQGSNIIKVGGDWNNDGTFTKGSSTVEMMGTNAAAIYSPISAPTNFVNDGFSTWPGIWSGDIGTSNGFFNKNTSSNAGGSSPEVRFFWINSNTTRRLYSGPFNTTGISSMDLSFKHMVDDFNGSGYTIKVQYSANGVNWYDTDWSISPTGNINATDVTTTLTSASHGVGASNYYVAFTITGNLYNIDYWYIDNVVLSYLAEGDEKFHNLTISKEGSAVTTMGDVTVENDLLQKPDAYLTNGTGNILNIGNDFILESDDTGMASFIDNGATTVSGNMKEELYLTTQSWHYVSSPMSDAETGVFLDIYLRSFDESTFSWNEYITSETDPLVPLMGYAAWVPGATPQTVIYSGAFNNGPKSINVTSNGPTNSVGWNLVGNPYPSSLDWDASGWTKTHVNNTIYYYSGNGGVSNYSYYVGASGEIPGVGSGDGTNEIPPMQGFFVHASGNGTFNVNNNARIHSSQSYYKEKTETPLIRILAQGLQGTDETVIRFISDANYEFDGNYDAFKLFADDLPQVYTITPGETELAVNSLPEIAEELVVPLSFTAPTVDEYSLTFSELENFDPGQVIFLEDLLTGTIKEVSPMMAYNFTYDESISNRFLIHFNATVSTMEDDETHSCIYAHDHFLYVKSPENRTSEIILYDMTGRKLMQHDVAGHSGLTRIDVPYGPGNFVVKCISEDQIFTKKVFIH